MTVRFQTERLVVRPAIEADAQALFDVYGDPQVTRFVTPGGQAAPALGFINAQIAAGMFAQGEDPRFGFWVAQRRDDDSVIGTVALVALDDDPDQYEMGWHLARAAWGQGYAFESGIGLLRYAFDDVGLERVYALAHPDNHRSLRACARLGLQPAGRRMYQGYEHETFVAERGVWSEP